MSTSIPRSFLHRPAPKVVSIPVHFVGSMPAPPDTKQDNIRAPSAIRIQKVFRGFLVRKSIREILAIGTEVDRVGRRVLDGLDSIRKDPKERLKMNETLMGLLFKLDSVRGVGPGVRDCRKAVIRKAIVLQEIIDGCDESRVEVADRGGDRDFEMGDGDVADGGMEIGDGTDQGLEIEGLIEKGDGGDESGADVANKIVGIEGDINVTENCNQDVEIEKRDGGGGDESGADVSEEFREVNGNNVTESSNRDLEIEDVDKEAVDLQEKIDGCDVSMANQAVDEDMVEGGDDQLKCDKSVNSEDEEDYCFVKQVVVGEKEYSDAKQISKGVENDCFGDELRSEKKSSDKEILERMMEENGKMMSMMKQLSEQNQAQTQMLTMLSHRVEHLEKAFVREVLRKKSKDKKKRMANGVTDVSDFCPKKR